jgi:molecular chaperone DnaK (HSP70)
MSTKQTPTVIGIDIGSSTVKIAAVQRGAIDVITNEANFR